MFYVGFIYLYLNDSYMPLRRNGPIIFEYTILLRRNIALIPVKFHKVVYDNLFLI